MTPDKSALISGCAAIGILAQGRVVSLRDAQYEVFHLYLRSLTTCLGETATGHAMW